MTIQQSRRGVMFRCLARVLHAIGVPVVYERDRIPAECLAYTPMPAEPYLDVPPPGHPERLRPDLPLTELELALTRQLRSERWI